MSELVAKWKPLLAELGGLGDALRGAIETDDIVTAIAASARMRQVRADLGAVEAARPTNEAEAVAELLTLTLNARAAEGVVMQWLARPLPGDATLLASPLGVAVLADSMLPAVWDLASDVVVLVGDELAPVAEVLVSLGQQRIVLHAPTVESVAAIVTRSDEELAFAVRTMYPCPPRRMAVRAHVSVARDAVEAVSKVVQDALSDLRIQRNTVCAFSRTWVDQGLANLPSLAKWPSIGGIGERLKGVPMVIVAPGPSLAKNSHLLRELRGKAVVAAFSHSLKPVLAAGVTPDVVISVDPQDLRYHFAGLDTSGSYLVNAATAHPSLYQLPARGFLGVAGNATIDDWMFDALGEDANAPGGGSVATTAFSIALRWGCDPIVFVGLDLSFPGGSYYVETSVDGDARADVVDGVVKVKGWSDHFHAMKRGGGPQAMPERSIELPGYYGGSVPSSFMFSMFHRWFVERIRGLGEIAPRVLNCTEGGAYIQGMVHAPLAEAIAAMPDGVDARARLDDAVAAVDQGARRDKLVTHLRGQLAAARQCRKLASKARALAVHAPERLGAVEERLMAALEPLHVASLLAQRELERAHDQARRPADAATYLAASTVVFDTLLAVLDQLEPALRTALAHIQERRAA